MNANTAMVEMQAGLTYHFGNSNGEHYMTLCDKKYTQADIDALNAEINALRARKLERKLWRRWWRKWLKNPSTS